MPAIGQPRDRWRNIYNFLRQQPPGTRITWRRLSEVAGHDTRASRSALARAKAELAVVDGLTVGDQTPLDLEVQAL
jgi:hypothetical protein